MADLLASLDRYRDKELTLEGLAEAAARLLRRLDVRPDDGRVAQTVDTRGIRYYQTLGIIARPLRYDGRRAVYGYSHLLQLLAAKRLQQEGHPLHLIQQALAVRSPDSLEPALTALLSGGSRPPVADGDADAAGADAIPRAPRLVTARVAPGVTVTVDPSVVADPEYVIALFERVVSASLKEK